MAQQRRGLPRTPGGAPWPPADTPIPEWAAATPAPMMATDAPPATPAPSSAPAPAATTDPMLTRRRTGLGQTPAALALAAEINAAVEQQAAAPTAPAPAAAVPTPQNGPAVAQATGQDAPVDAPDAVLARRRIGLGQTPAAVELAQRVNAALTQRAAAAAAQVAAAESAAASVQESVAQPAPATTAEPAASPASHAATRERKPFRRAPAKITLAAVGAVVVIAAIVLAVRWFLFDSAAGTSFLKAYPGATPLPKWAPVGQPLWTQWQHWLNAFFIVLIIKTGWTVRTQKKASAMWQPRGGGKKISVELFTHLALDIVWLVNGVLFWVLLFATGQWIRIVPFSWDFIPNALSAALQYVSLSWPTEDGWTNYNSLQVLTYFATVFLAAPLAAVTGFRMSPMWRSTWQRASKVYPVELARKIHFPVMVYFVLFVIVHIVLVLATGALRNLNHMFWGSDDPGSWAGFIVFLIGIAAIIGAWFALKPIVMQQIGSAFGKVGR